MFRGEPDWGQPVWGPAAAAAAAAVQHLAKLEHLVRNLINLLLLRLLDLLLRQLLRQLGRIRLLVVLLCGGGGCSLFGLVGLLVVLVAAGLGPLVGPKLGDAAGEPQRPEVPGQRTGGLALAALASRLGRQRRGLALQLERRAQQHQAANR